MINQSLNGIKVSPTNKYLNKTDNKTFSTINKTTIQEKLTYSSSNSPRLIKPITTPRSDINKTTIQEKTAYSSSNSLSLIKPITALISDNQNNKSSLNIHPPDSPNYNDSMHETNPRFSSHQISSPAVENPNSSQTNFKRSPNRHIKTQKHVHFDITSHQKLTSEDVIFYYNFGLSLSNQIGSQKRATYYLKIAADQGHVDSMVRYATIQYNGYRVGNPKSFRIEKDTKEAAAYFKKAMDKGDVRAMRHYRSMLYDGDGVEKDRRAAASLYKAEADKGVVGAISMYGTMLYLGDGIEKNLNEAVRYFRLAVEKKDRFGIRMLAYSYLTGSGVDYSLKEAVYYYKMAAEMGDDVSVKQIAKIADIGGDSYLSEEEIEKYCKMAADKGDTEAYKKYKAIIAAKKNK